MISFVSVHQAIKAEKVLAASGINVVALPTPREISVSCGQCISLPAADLEKTLNLLTEAHVQWARLYSHERDRVFELMAEYGGQA